MRRLPIILSLMFMCGCTTIVEKDTYLKYSGYIEGCADATVPLVLNYQGRENVDPERLAIFVDTMCMYLYLEKLERDDIKPPEGIDKHLDRNEMI